MGFEHNGKLWKAKTAEEHAQAILQKTNRLLQEHAVTDAEGRIVQLRPSFANALYLLMLAAGDSLADMDERLLKALNSFNLSLCDDQQILNLLPIAGTQRSRGTYSTVVLSCTASKDGDCTIEKGVKAAYKDVYFVVQETVHIEQGSTKDVPAVCQTVGPVVALSGDITTFTQPVKNLETVINKKSSIAGKEAETINDVRRRLISGNTITYNLDGCTAALAALAGVNYARVYFNHNTKEAIVIAGGIKIKPRHAYIVIHGQSALIAETYAEHMNAPTQNAEGQPEQKQYYITQSDQHIPVYFDSAQEKHIFVKITVEGTAAYDVQVINQLKIDLLKAAAYWTIGQPITQAVTTAPFVNSTYTTVAYTQVSEDGLTWRNIVIPKANAIPCISDTAITVEQL